MLREHAVAGTAPDIPVRVDRIETEAELVLQRTPGDVVFPAIGALATAIAAGMTPFVAVAEALADETASASGGRARPGIWFDADLDLAPRSWRVNSHLWPAVGTALAFRLRGDDRAVCCQLDAPIDDSALAWAVEHRLALVVLLPTAPPASPVTATGTATATGTRPGTQTVTETAHDGPTWARDIWDAARRGDGPVVVAPTVVGEPGEAHNARPIREQLRRQLSQGRSGRRPNRDRHPAEGERRRVHRPPQVAAVDYGEAITLTLQCVLTADTDVVVVGSDVRRGGPFGTTAGLVDRFGARRVIDLPIPPADLVGVGVGLARSGFRPVVELPIADVSLQALPAILGDVARWEYRSNGAERLPLVLRIPWGAGVGGGLDGSLAIESLLAHIPRLPVVVPSTPHDAAHLLAEAIAEPGPVVVLEHKKLHRAIRGPIGEEAGGIGRAEIVRSGRHATVLAYGLHRHLAERAADRLAVDGYEIEVVDVRSLAPLDDGTILESVRRCGRVLIVHEDHRSYGAGAELAARIAEQALFDLDAPPRRLAGSDDIPGMPFAAGLELAVSVTTDRLVDALRELLAF